MTREEMRSEFRARPTLEPPSGRGPSVCLCSHGRDMHNRGPCRWPLCGCGEFRPDTRPVRTGAERHRGEESA